MSKWDIKGSTLHRHVSITSVGAKLDHPVKVILNSNQLKRC